MADDDPVAALLKRTPVPNTVRSTLWNAYYDAQTSDDLAKVLQTIKMPDSFKSELWNLKESESSQATPELPAEKPYSGPPLPMPAAASAGMPPPTMVGSSPVERFAADYAPNVEVSGEPIVPFGVLAAGGTALAAAKGAQLVRAIPTRAKAAAKFAEVAKVVGKRPVETGGRVNASVVELVDELGTSGGTAGKPATDLYKWLTNPNKPELNYDKARKFYNNISRLSTKQIRELNPIVQREYGELRAALHEAIAKTAASGGKEDVYRAAMKEYAVASKIKTFVDKTVKYGGAAVATALGGRLLYNVAVD